MICRYIFLNQLRITQQRKQTAAQRSSSKPVSVRSSLGPLPWTFATCWPAAAQIQVDYPERGFRLASIYDISQTVQERKLCEYANLKQYGHVDDHPTGHGKAGRPAVPALSFLCPELQSE
jgi:hypothetical protein